MNTNIQDLQAIISRSKLLVDAKKTVLLEFIESCDEKTLTSILDQMMTEPDRIADYATRVIENEAAKGETPALKELLRFLQVSRTSLNKTAEEAMHSDEQGTLEHFFDSAP